VDIVFRVEMLRVGLALSGNVYIPKMTWNSCNCMESKVDELSQGRIVAGSGCKVDIQYTVEMSRRGLPLSGPLSQWSNRPLFGVDKQFVHVGSECRSSNLSIWYEMSRG
jgi:hypothetical protein